MQLVAERIRDCVRGVDIVGRYGGDEFVLLLTETDVNGAREVAERLCSCVGKEAVSFENQSIPVSVSIGLTEMAIDCRSLEDLLGQADMALYAAKQDGKNQVRGN